jgi:hypothetical protein
MSDTLSTATIFREPGFCGGLFGKVTGRDPPSLGPTESAAGAFGFSLEQATALQQVAHDELAAQP